MVQKMQKIGRFWTKVVILFGLLPLIVGCGVDKKSFLPELDAAFSCHVSGECGGEAFEATVSAGEWIAEQDGEQTRSLRVVYTAPEHLRGLIAMKNGNEYTLTLDGVQITGSHLLGFLLPARLLGDSFEVTDTRVQKNEGRAICEVLGNAPNGSRQVKIDSDSGEILWVAGTLDGLYAEFCVENLK